MKKVVVIIALSAISFGSFASAFPGKTQHHQTKNEVKKADAKKSAAKKVKKHGVL